jgi:pantoate--beta-alanine ligase
VNPVAELIHDIAQMQSLTEGARLEGKTIGVVPTMGALHEGHCSLIRLARRRSDLVVVTLFVNPTQFGPGEDFARYPRTLERDLEAAARAGADVIFAPEAGAMYPEGSQTSVEVGELASVLEGAARPGHFRGVATVVAKLFHITRPHLALFGQKDAQQVAVIRQMVRDLNFPVEIVVGPTIREADGLAMSSRNAYLDDRQRREAPVLFRSLALAERLVLAGERDGGAVRAAMASLIRAESSGVIDYVSVADPATLRELQQLPGGGEVLVSLAVRFGSTRLIDNCRVPV